MRILIIGSNGFIGSHLIEHFILKKENEVFGCDVIESSDPNYFCVDKFSPSFNDIFEDRKFDICIYAGGNGSVPNSITNPEMDFQLNTIAINKILTSIQQFQPNCKFIHFSSAAVYGNPDKLPINEESKIEPLSPYGWHKYVSEIICKKFTTLYNIPTISLRIFSVYGKGLKKQLFWDIYQKVKESTQITLYGTGNETRDFIHFSDLIAAIELLIAKAKFEGEVYNVASGRETTISEAARVFSVLYKKDLIINFGGQFKTGDPINWRADINKINSLGFSTKVNLNEGLENYVTWLKENE